MSDRWNFRDMQHAQLRKHYTEQSMEDWLAAWKLLLDRSPEERRVYSDAVAEVVACLGECRTMQELCDWYNFWEDYKLGDVYNAQAITLESTLERVTNLANGRDLNRSIVEGAAFFSRMQQLIEMAQK